MAKKLPKPKLAKAGPGAGKTHAMVNEIVTAVKELSPHRFLAAITYTNAAANTIRERLSRHVRPKRNVFVGTIHSFMNRFILAPCASLMSVFPDESIYAAIDVYEKGRGASQYTKNLINKGIVPYDAIVPKSREILKISGVSDRICERLAYIFIDEFQDADIGMLEVLECFRKAGRTKIYVVGDPEQYVMSFTYRGQSPPVFDNIPFFRFEKHTDVTLTNENHRSNGEIVAFANQFRDDLKQCSIKPFRNEPRVIFIPSANLEEIIQCFQTLSENVETEGDQLTRLYLSENNLTFSSVCDQFQLSSISNIGRKNNSLLGEALELLSVALDRSQRKACDDFGMSRLQWRAVGIRLLMQIRSGQFGIEPLMTLIENTFRFKMSKSRIKISEESLVILSDELNRNCTAKASELYSSIRKAKGLQADAVLVVAKGINELKKWLQTDCSCRIVDKQDKCRLGYVAFTRPREMLCIACLEEPDIELVQMFHSLCISYNI